MSKASVIRSTTEKMQILGTYRPEFDDLIARYAEMVEKYSKFAKKVKGDDDISTESAAGTSKLSPMVRVVSDLRRDILMMEVGALMVGKIVNHHQAASVKRGPEKGYFQFGGSTVILVVPAAALRFDEDLVRNSSDGLETLVRCGERIAMPAAHQH